MNFNVARVWFVFSLVALSFVYGAAVGKWEWFPYSFIDQATDQAREVLKQYEGNSMPPHHDQVFERQGTRIHKPGEVASGMTTITSWWKTSEGPKVGMKLLNREGTVLHKWLVETGEVFDNGGNIQGSLLLPDGDVLLNWEYVGTARLNSCGEVLWTQSERNHHSIARADDGSFWIPATSPEQVEGSSQHPEGYPGLGSVWVDRILHVSKNGEILDDINVLDLIYENDLQRFIFQYNPKRRETGDLTHLNDIDPLSASIADEYPTFDSGDLLVSLRRLNLIFVFNPDTKSIKWYSKDPFVWQHDPDFIGDGWVGVFDNNVLIGDNPEYGSKIVALQPHTDSTYTLFEPSKLDRFYTYHRGKWQMLGNGNMLLTEEEAGRALEVSAEGEPVWEWVHESYDSKTPSVTPSVTKATRHDLTREDVADWPCSSVDSDGPAARSN